ncbi:MAG: pilus assembly protein TadG-related protein [Acidimicrobiales bacterium]
MALPIVAIGLVALLGAAAFTIDLGHVWQERRNLITSTDAAALAAAKDNALQTGDGCANGTAASYMASNHDAASMAGCTVVNHNGTSGFVTVEANTNVDYFFGPAIGLNNTNVYSSTSASWAQPSTAEGLRPMGMCVDFLNGLTPTIVPGNGVVYRIPYGKDSQPDACGGEAPGNWGMIDFNGGANNNNDTKDWVLNGYPGEVVLNRWYEGDTGAYSPSIASELTAIMALDYFGLPIFDGVRGNGANAEFFLVNFAAVKLVGFQITGPEADRYMDLMFVNGVIQGTGGPPMPNLGARVIGICATDATSTAAC